MLGHPVAGVRGVVGLAHEEPALIRGEISRDDEETQPPQQLRCIARILRSDIRVSHVNMVPRHTPLDAEDFF